MQLRLQVAFACAALLLQGCETPRPVVAGPPQEAGRARACDASPVTIAGTTPAEATIRVGNDGGWCALRLSQANGEPYAAGLLATPPRNGKIYIHKAGKVTRVDYTPDAGFTGTDSFVVKLLPGYAPVHATVTVTPPPAPAAPAS